MRRRWAGGAEEVGRSWVGGGEELVELVELVESTLCPTWMMTEMTCVARRSVWVASQAPRRYRLARRLKYYPF